MITEEELYMLFVRGLRPEIKTSMGVYVLEGLGDAISWAQRIDSWHSREGAEQEENLEKENKKES